MNAVTLEPKRTVQEPRRVLWVMKGLGRGGVERLAVSSARCFDRSRYIVDVAYVLRAKDAFVPDLRAAGVTVHCVGASGERLGWASALARLVRQGTYDLVHTHSPVPALAIRALPATRRPPVVHTEHNMWSRYRRPTRVANALTFARNAGAIAVSRGVASSMRRGVRRGPEPIVVHHGIDLSSVERGASARTVARQRLGLAPDAAVIGIVANFTPKKDHVTLLRAVRLLAGDRPHLRLILVGSGPWNASYGVASPPSTSSGTSGSPARGRMCGRSCRRSTYSH